jgi:protein ImuB
MPAPVLRQRFCQDLLVRLDQTLEQMDEVSAPLTPPAPYVERLPCLEPSRTAVGSGSLLKLLILYNY